MSKIIPLLGMFATLAAAWALDRGTAAYQEFVTASFQGIAGLVWLHVLANLLVMGALFALAWLAVLRGEPSRLVAWIYLISGGLLALFPALHFSAPPSLEFLFTRETGPLRFALLGTGMVSRFALANAFVAVTGLAGLVIHGNRLPR